MHDLPDDVIEQLNQEILLKYGIGRLSDRASLSQIAARAEQHGYGASVADRGMLIQGDVQIGGTYNAAAPQ